MPRSVRHVRADFEAALQRACIQCVQSLPSAASASAMRWFNVLCAGTGSAATYADIGAACVRQLAAVATELGGRWTPQAAVLRSRFGLYGRPLDPELFDTELATTLLANASRSAGSSSHGSGISGSTGGAASTYSTAVMDLKRMCADDASVAAYVYPIKRRCVSNQLRGLLEVEPLHFTCCASSDSARVEVVDTGSGGGALAAASAFGASSASSMQLQMLDDAMYLQDVPSIDELYASKSKQTLDKLDKAILDMAMGVGSGGTNAGLYEDYKALGESDIVNNVKNMLADKLFSNSLSATAKAPTKSKSSGTGGNKMLYYTTKDGTSFQKADIQVRFTSQGFLQCNRYSQQFLQLINFKATVS